MYERIPMYLQNMRISDHFLFHIYFIDNIRPGLMLSGLMLSVMVWSYVIYDYLFSIATTCLSLVINNDHQYGAQLSIAAGRPIGERFIVSSAPLRQSVRVGGRAGPMIVPTELPRTNG